jgi:O-antigen ligase
MRHAAAEHHVNARAELGLLWIVYALGGAVVLALVAKPTIAFAAAVLVLFALVAIRLPELPLVAFVVVGTLKSTDVGARLSAVAPVDLSALTAAGLTVAVCCSLWRYRHEPFGVATPVLAFLALLVLLLVWVPASPDPVGGLRKAHLFESFSALAFLAPLAIVRTRQSLYRLLAIVVGVGVLVGLSAKEAERSDSVLVLPGADNQIQVGLLLGLAVVAVVAYLWPASVGWVRVFWLVPAAFALVKLISAGGRSALVGAVLACVVALVCLLRSGGRDRIAAVALVGVLAALAPAAWVTSSPAVKERYLVTIDDLQGGSGLDSGGADRSALADSAIGVFADHPLGAGTASYPALTGYEWPHNLVLEVASEQGVVGVTLLLVLFAGTAVSLQRAATSPTIRREVIAGGSLIILPLTVALSSFDLNGNRILWFATGLALATARLQR